MSLAKLATQFNLNVGKGIEPVYTGNDPDYANFKMSDLSHYSKEVERIDVFIIWKERVEDYCIQDCIVLYNILVKFQDLINDKFNLDITKYLTTPSLAFAIYRMHYMPAETIPVTKGKVFNFIKQSFTGGSTEMYNPNAIGKNIFCYDVNSLYPAVIAQSLYPTGQIFYFEGDPSFLTDSTYWIGESIVETRKDLYQPYLQIHHKTDAGWRTVAPNGRFEMVIHSPEYENALKDYKISVNKGYMFESKTDLFSKYVNDMYTLRQEYSKGDPMNLIAKLLLNFFYGRFGMEPQFHSHIFANFEEIQKLAAKYEILDYLEIDKEIIFFVTYQSIDNKDLDKSLPRRKSSGVSVSIASAVTSYARVYMSQFKKQ